MAKELANTIINHQLDNGKEKISTYELIEYLSAIDFLQEIYGIGDTIIQELARRAAIPTNITLLTQLEESSVVLGHPLAKKST